MNPDKCCRTAIIIPKSEYEARKFQEDVNKVLDLFLGKEVDEFEARAMLSKLERVAAERRGIEPDPTSQDPNFLGYSGSIGYRKGKPLDGSQLELKAIDKDTIYIAINKQHPPAYLSAETLNDGPEPQQYTGTLYGVDR